jgi:hypothetical protein
MGNVYLNFSTNVEPSMSEIRLAGIEETNATGSASDGDLHTFSGDKIADVSRMWQVLQEGQASLMHGHAQLKYSPHASLYRAVIFHIFAPTESEE